MAGRGGERDAQQARLVRDELDRRGGDGVIIALRAQQPHHQGLVLLGASPDHGAVDRLAARILERGEVAEAVLEPDLLEPFDDQAVADRHRLLGGAFGRRRLGRHDVGGERRQRLGQRRIAERRILDRPGLGREWRSRRSGRILRLDRLERPFSSGSSGGSASSNSVGNDRLVSRRGAPVGRRQLRVRRQGHCQNAPGKSRQPDALFFQSSPLASHPNRCRGRNDPGGKRFNFRHLLQLAEGRTTGTAPSPTTAKPDQ